MLGNVDGVPERRLKQRVRTFLVWDRIFKNHGQWFKGVVSHPEESSSHCRMQGLPAAPGCVLGKKDARRAWLSEENQDAGPGVIYLALLYLPVCCDLLVHCSSVNACLRLVDPWLSNLHVNLLIPQILKL